jgi:hypothetical protein
MMDAVATQATQAKLDDDRMAQIRLKVRADPRVRGSKDQ